MLEFLFCMIVIMLMIYSMMMIFRWVGVDMAERRIAHDRVLFQGGILTDGVELEAKDIFVRSSVVQVDRYFYKPIKMNAVHDWF